MTEQEFLDNVLYKIDQKKLSGKKVLIMKGLSIPDNTAKFVEKYISENTNHLIEITKCTNCKGFWDIYIWIRS